MSKYSKRLSQIYLSLPLKMVFPVEIHVGSAHIHVHLLCEMLAYTLGYRFYTWLRARTQDLIGDENRLWIFIGAAFGAFWGSHILGSLEQPIPAGGLTFLYFFANKTIVGGFLGGLAGVEITKKVLGVYTSSGDLMTYPIILALIIGRLGCHFEGLNDGTYGLPSTLPWAIDFGDGIPRHPVNLYEIVWLLTLAFLIFTLEKPRPLRNGRRFQIFMIGYLAYRLGIEYFKPAHYWPGIGLSSIQIACAGGLLYYLLLAILRKR